MCYFDLAGPPWANPYRQGDGTIGTTGGDPTWVITYPLNAKADEKLDCIRKIVAIEAMSDADKLKCIAALLG